MRLLLLRNARAAEAAIVEEQRHQQQTEQRGELEFRFTTTETSSAPASSGAKTPPAGLANAPKAKPHGPGNRNRLAFILARPAKHLLELDGFGLHGNRLLLCSSRGLTSVTTTETPQQCRTRSLVSLRCVAVSIAGKGTGWPRIHASPNCARSLSSAFYCGTVTPQLSPTPRQTIRVPCAHERGGTG